MDHLICAFFFKFVYVVLEQIMLMHDACGQQTKPAIIDHQSTMYSVLMWPEEVRIYPVVVHVGVSGRWCQSIQQGGCQDCTSDTRYH